MDPDLAKSFGSMRIRIHNTVWKRKISLSKDLGTGLDQILPLLCRLTIVCVKARRDSLVFLLKHDHVWGAILPPWET
jgi:hypothetical protein